MDTSRWMPILLLVALAAGAYYLFVSPNSEKFYKKGLTYYAEKDYERAETEFLKAISEAQEEQTPAAKNLLADAYLMAGEILETHLGRFKRAAALYDEMALLLDPAPATLTARLRTAAIYRDKLNNPNRAAAIYEELIERSPRDARIGEVRRLVMDIYLAMHEFEQAAVQGRAFLEQFPDAPQSAEIRFRVADALVYQERWAEAMVDYRAVSERFPGSYYARLAAFEVGNCLLKMGRNEEAAQVYESALSTYPNPEVVRLRLSEVHGRMKNEKDKKNLPSWAQKSAEAAFNGKVDPFPESKGGRKAHPESQRFEFPPSESGATMDDVPAEQPPAPKLRKPKSKLKTKPEAKTTVPAKPDVTAKPAPKGEVAPRVDATPKKPVEPSESAAVNAEPSEKSPSPVSP